MRRAGSNSAQILEFLPQKILFVYTKMETFPVQQFDQTQFMGGGGAIELEHGQWSLTIDHFSRKTELNPNTL